MDKSNQKQTEPAVSRADLWPLTGILLLILVLYHPLLFGRPVMPDTWERFEPWNSELGYDGPLDPRIENANNDAILLYIPWNKFAHDELNAGRIPAWDPYCLCGVPLVSNHLVPVFYPVYWVIARFFAPLLIMGMSGLVHTLILAFFFYLFIREWLGNRIAAWMAASFLVVSLIPNPHYQPWPMTIAWFPAIWFFYERWLKHRSPWSGLWMALCWACPLLAGYPSLFFQMSLFTAVWILVRPNMMPVEERPKFASRVWILILPFVLALGISAVQNVPTVMASMESERSVFKTSEELAQEAAFTIPTNQPWQTHVKRLLQPIIPFRFEKNDFFNRGHIGVLPVIFALFGLGWLRRKEYPRLILLLALIIGPFALIPTLNFGFYWITRGTLIDPNPPVEVFGFLVLMLSAAGVKNWLPANEEKSPGTPPGTPPFRVGVGAPESGDTHPKGWGTGDIGDNGDNVNNNENPSSIPNGDATKGIIIAIIAAALATVASILIDNESFVPGLTVIGGSAAGLAVMSFAFLYRSGSRIYVNYGLTLIVVVLVFNALFCGQLYYSPRQGLDGIPMPETPTITALKELTDPDLGGEWGRIIRYSENPVNVMSLTDQPYTFYPNLGTYFHIPDAFGYHNLAPKSRLDYLREIQEDAVIERRGIVAFTDDMNLNDPRFGVPGIRWVLSDYEIAGNTPVIEGKGIYVYKIDGSIPICISPRVYYVSNWRFRGYSDEVFEPSLRDPYRHIDFSDDPGRITVDINLQSEEGLIALTEGHSAGWSAYLDGEPTFLNVEHLNLMVVRVPSGRHTVEFRYITPGLKVGWIITAFSLFIWLLAGAFITSRRLSRR